MTDQIRKADIENQVNALNRTARDEYVTLARLYAQQRDEAEARATSERQRRNAAEQSINRMIEREQADADYAAQIWNETKDALERADARASMLGHNAIVNALIRARATIL